MHIIYYQQTNQNWKLKPANDPSKKQIKTDIHQSIGVVQCTFTFKKDMSGPNTGCKGSKNKDDIFLFQK